MKISVCFKIKSNLADDFIFQKWERLKQEILSFADHEPLAFYLRLLSI
jgi:hypothetical protein